MQLLKFYAEWCGPCKILTKTMENMKFPYEVVQVNIDENTDLALNYGVRTVPTLILINDKGDVIERMSNSKATPSVLLETFVDKHV